MSGRVEEWEGGGVEIQVGKKVILPDMGTILPPAPILRGG